MQLPLKPVFCLFVFLNRLDSTQWLSNEYSNEAITRSQCDTMFIIRDKANI